MTSDSVIIHYKINPETLGQAIDEASKLEDNQAMLKELTAITKAKNDLKDLLETVEKYESAAKGLINAKAKQLYGEDWQAIAGDNYKITRSFTGAVYTRNPDIPVLKKFIKVVESIDTKAVDAYRDEKSALPKGVELNPTRGESIRITLK